MVAAQSVRLLVSISPGRMRGCGRFRIVVPLVLCGPGDDAQVGYDSLQGEYPSVAEGREYAGLAKVFWETYRGTLDIDTACADADGYADGNRRVVLARLGDSYCDYPNRSYEPEDICPFTKNWAARLESYLCSRVISCGCRSRLMLSEPTMLPWSAGMAGRE